MNIGWRHGAAGAPASTRSDLGELRRLLAMPGRETPKRSLDGKGATMISDRVYPGDEAPADGAARQPYLSL
jgi:hypothetical protein